MTAANSKKQQSRNKPRGKSFKPGQSGNPSGRPKLTPEMVEVRTIAQQHTVRAIQTAVSIMGDDTAAPAARLSAVNIILERGHGRPAQTVDVKGSLDVTTRPARAAQFPEYEGIAAKALESK